MSHASHKKSIGVYRYAMHTYYGDILERIPEKPKWFDENAVPRYCAFSPDDVADIYCSQACLAEILCQSCQTSFQVAFSWYRLGGVFGREHPPLREAVTNRFLNYGDPPNIHCCAPGPTMSSDMQRVLEFWVKDESTTWEWARVSELEIDLSDT